jgi:predicted  nucleic acid-binding Zn-ribbon protein
VYIEKPFIPKHVHDSRREKEMTEKFEWKKIEAQLDELRAQINDLLKRLETAVDKEAEALRPRLKAAQQQLHELKQTSLEAWGDLKPGLGKAWEELHESLNQAASRFKTRRK